MTHRGPFQPLPFCDSVILCTGWKVISITLIYASTWSPQSAKPGRAQTKYPTVIPATT